MRVQHCAAAITALVPEQHFRPYALALCCLWGCIATCIAHGTRGLARAHQVSVALLAGEWCHLLCKLRTRNVLCLTGLHVLSAALLRLQRLQAHSAGAHCPGPVGSMLHQSKPGQQPSRGQQWCAPPWTPWLDDLARQPAVLLLDGVVNAMTCPIAEPGTAQAVRACQCCAKANEP